MVLELARAAFTLKWLFLILPTHKPMLRSRLNKVFGVKNFSIIPRPKKLLWVIVSSLHWLFVQNILFSLFLLQKRCGQSLQGFWERNSCAKKFNYILWNALLHVLLLLLYKITFMFGQIYFVVIYQYIQIIAT